MTGDRYREARLQSRSNKQVKILKSFLKINLEEKKKKNRDIGNLELREDFLGTFGARRVDRLKYKRENRSNVRIHVFGA